MAGDTTNQIRASVTLVAELSDLDLEVGLQAIPVVNKYSSTALPVRGVSSEVFFEASSDIMGYQ
jgi:hypothetical protein